MAFNKAFGSFKPPVYSAITTRFVGHPYVVPVAIATGLIMFGGKKILSHMEKENNECMKNSIKPENQDLFIYDAKERKIDLIAECQRLENIFPEHAELRKVKCD
ncbi:MAG: hypothetical protein Edafosvirus1_76 [Edafosvirus sp.]|uniref:Uncharacterized protein n=1 Tax=Edafosvirus sp. TaxID=2487765 RepID=A0A3G4ZS80_9VIRU|nr:MAG: hypothetical protein Edafosvirus1_76 [Edafosvirus sp.]